MFFLKSRTFSILLLLNKLVGTLSSLYCPPCAVNQSANCLSECHDEKAFCKRGAKTMFGVFRCLSCQYRCLACCIETKIVVDRKMADEEQAVVQKDVVGLQDFHHRSTALIDQKPLDITKNNQISLDAELKKAKFLKLNKMKCMQLVRWYLNIDAANAVCEKYGR